MSGFGVNLFPAWQTCSHLRGHLVHTMGNLWLLYDTVYVGPPIQADPIIQRVKLTNMLYGFLTSCLRINRQPL